MAALAGILHHRVSPDTANGKGDKAKGNGHEIDVEYGAFAFHA
jgi:hypothetical protein